MSGSRVPETLARWGYTALYLPAFPLVFGYWMARADSRARLGEYLGGGHLGPSSKNQGPIWVHAVSVGEAVAAMPILRELQSDGHEFFLTTTIQDAEQAAFRHDVAFRGVSFFPLDVPWFLDRLLDRVQPQAVLVSETDLWPNFLTRLKARGIPAVLVNGRVSPKLARAWSRLSCLGRPALDAFCRAYVQTEKDRERLLAMGLPSERIEVAGNTKYQVGDPPALPKEFAQAMTTLEGLGADWLVAGSTHDPEEGLLLDVLGEDLPKVRLMLVPRIPSRAAEVLHRAKRAKRRAVLWSQFAELPLKEQVEADPEVVVVDVMGQLARLYALGTVAYVGGGFGSLGGHNFLEAAQQAKPILGGPNFRNFAHDVEAFRPGEGFVSCADSSQVRAQLRALFQDPTRARERGQAARATLAKGGKATATTVAGIRELLAGASP